MVLYHVQFRDTQKLSTKCQCMDQAIRKKVKRAPAQQHEQRMAFSPACCWNLLFTLRKNKKNLPAEIQSSSLFHDQQIQAHLSPSFMSPLILSYLHSLFLLFLPLIFTFIWYHLPTVLLKPLWHFTHWVVMPIIFFCTLEPFLHATYCCWSILRI